LRNIQRLLAEGQFVASYKFALVHALADLAVLKGDDTGGPLDLDTNEISARFVELYWQQCRPFQVGGQDTGLVLQQNTGRQAKIILQIVDSQQKVGGSLFRFKQSGSTHWSKLVSCRGAKPMAGQSCNATRRQAARKAPDCSSQLGVAMCLELAVEIGKAEPCRGYNCLNGCGPPEK